MVRDLVNLADLIIGSIARRLHGEIGLLPKTGDARRRCGIDASHWLVALVPALAVVRTDVSFVLFNLGRRISVLGWCWQNLVGRGIAGGVVGFAAPIVRTLRRSRSAILAQFVHRHALTNEPCQFGKRIVSLGARRLLRAAPTKRIAIGTLIVFSHEIQLVQPLQHTKAPKLLTSSRRLRIPSGSTNKRVDLSHLVWRFDPEQCQPRCEHGGNPLNKHKPGFGQLSIILDNEA